MPKIQLEDNFTDILGKAQRGLGFSDSDLAHRAGITPAQLSVAKASGNPPLNPLRGRGTIDETVIRKVAAALNLGPDALVASAKQSWRPVDPGSIDGLACFNTPFSDMTVNAYLVWDPITKRAAVFDTGTDCDPMLELARDRQLKIELIFLTHTHSDHVYELDRLKEVTGAAAYVSERETISGATPFKDGQVFEFVERASRPLTGQSSAGVPPVDAKTSETLVPPGRRERAGRPRYLRIEARRTSGHARGGTTFVVTGLPTVVSAGGVRGRSLAIVGDALFAGSMGGGLVDYDEALRTNRASIFTLSDDTIICPGHGPLTTVGEEKQHNPFFPEFQRK